MKSIKGTGGGGRKFSMIPFVERKNIDKDEDLVLFRELNKREKDRFASLLQPVSDEFEPNAGNHALYRIGSGKKGSGNEFLGENNNKNDYDWLKTPPATPLFPSLEMEATAPELVVQREIPIIQPLSRVCILSSYFIYLSICIIYLTIFSHGNIKSQLSILFILQFAGNSAATIKGRPNSPKPKPKPKIPVRSITRSQRPNINSSTETKNTKETTFPNYNKTTTSSSPTTHLIPNSKRTDTNQKESQDHFDFITSNLSKTLGLTDTKTKPRSRGVSPSMRSKIPAQIPGFSNETPPNLRTDHRSTSATRGRPVTNQSPSTHINQRPKSVTRSRKVMNARKSGAEERETKANLRCPNNSEVTAGFIARNMMPKSSLNNMPLKHNVVYMLLYF
ncbi:hypothetical protein CISIN_1g038796mg [Citrus sinensis]|uniref:Uncharacterized protein n=1 Tax=Citrus sinensis TaxID=2711 RepID=A0A067GN72_CITSI|nr:hypothetical protein CISIN_1g038796mg [Citrus sinensis]